jgi:hypothetical protein
MKTSLPTLVLSFLFVLAGACPSQGDTRPSRQLRVRDGGLVMQGEGGASRQLLSAPSEASIEPFPSDRIVAPGGELFEDATRVQYNSYVRDQYKHALDVFQWQHKTSKVIFVTVIILVFSGLIFAALQFYWSYDHGKRKVQRGKQAAAEHEAGEIKLKLGLSGVEVASPILGVAILVISLAFFYLYLVHIYPIQPLGK